MVMDTEFSHKFSNDVSFDGYSRDDLRDFAEILFEIGECLQSTDLFDNMIDDARGRRMDKVRRFTSRMSGRVNAEIETREHSLSRLKIGGE